MSRGKYYKVSVRRDITTTEYGVVYVWADDQDDAINEATQSDDIEWTYSGDSDYGDVEYDDSIEEQSGSVAYDQCDEECAACEYTSEECENREEDEEEEETVPSPAPAMAVPDCDPTIKCCTTCEKFDSCAPAEPPNRAMMEDQSHYTGSESHLMGCSVCRYFKTKWMDRKNNTFVRLETPVPKASLTTTILEEIRLLDIPPPRED